MLLCCLQKEPDHRFGTMREVHAEMGHIASALGVPLPAIAAEALAFSGRWAGEMAVDRVSLSGGLARGSRAGSRTAHDAFPALVVGSSAFGAASVWATFDVLDFAAAGDFDGDGEDDLAGMEPGGACIYVMLADGGSFEDPRIWTCPGAGFC